ncbi:MAG TPA: PQQ-dependent sugar dehydrogenase, partial [Terriglobia bacterium]|nr:PQQ-dependent sugar dehydrogenase [Terriglobia bacterium]
MKKIIAWTAGILIAATVIGLIVIRRSDIQRIPSPSSCATFNTEDYRICVRTITRDLTHPWSLAFLPNGDMLVTERPGRLRLIHDGILQSRPIEGIPAVNSTEQEGLLDIALNPRFVENQRIYFTYSKPGPMSTIALARGRFDGARLNNVEEIFVTDARSRQEGTMGGRLAFEPDGTLLMTVGERHDRTPSQDPGSHGGKILRLRDDGTAAPDNPFVHQAGYRMEIFAMGVRNPQGLSIHPTTGVIYETEHGPMGGDELNIILPGKNYGWPQVTYGKNYDGSVITNETSRPGLESPVHYWVPSIGPSGLAVYTGTLFPKWRDNLFVGAM